MSTSTHPSDYALDRGGADIVSHLAACETCRARGHAAEAVAERFRTDVLPRTLPRVRERATRPARRAWLLALPLAGAAAAGLWLVAAGPPTPSWDGIKGSPTGPTIEVFVRRKAEVFRLEGQRLQPGDALGFVVRADRRYFLEVRGRDARGAETRIFPVAQEVDAVMVRPGDKLPRSATLDAAPGREEIVGIFHDRPFPLGGPLPDGAIVVRIPLEKE